MTTNERFWKNVAKSTDGCWLWTAGKNSKGYGALYGTDLPGKQMYAHRYSWITHFGDIPDGQARHDTTTMIAMQSLYARMVP